MLAALVGPGPPSESGRPTALAVLQDVTELRRLERVRRDFVANIGHELRACGCAEECQSRKDQNNQ